MVFKPCGVAAVDPLGYLAAGGGRAARRVAKTRVVGRRISAAELRERGVDEAFLAPARCIDDGLEAPADDGRTPEAVAFVAGGVSFAGQHIDGGAAVQPAHPVEAVASRTKSEPAWSAGEMQAEYGVGYALLVAMGYQGGGRVPLAGVKRQERVALQDNEALALDRSCPLASKKGRKAAGVARALQRPAPPGGEVEMARALEAHWGAGAPGEDGAAPGASAAPEAGEREASEDEGFDFAAGTAGRLQRALLAELRRAGGRLALAELVQRPRVERALLEHPDCGEAGQGFARAFILSSLPQCRVRQSLAPALAKISRSSSSAPWDSATCREPVVALRRGRRGGGGSPEAEDSSSDESSGSSPDAEGRAAVDGEAAPLDGAAAARPSQAPDEPRWCCHGCQRRCPSRALLREHLAERLCARTTRDPTDLSARFDPEHWDREALLGAARAAALDGGPVRPGGGVGSAARWHCPACSWSSEAASDFEQLLEHADLSPARRVEHRRLLSLIADLLLQEPPPAPPQHGERSEGARQWSHPDLARLLRALTVSTRGAGGEGDVGHEYRQLEEQVLGPQESDIFTAL